MAFTVPGYQVDQLLGYGSHAEVWSGTAAISGERVALKRIVLPRQSDPQRAAELLAAARVEAALLAALEHPNLIRFHQYVQTQAAAVLVMELAEGGSLARLLRRRDRLTPAEVAAALTPIAAALDYAHSEGVRHGDVSAANILFTGIGQPKLADLGVARLLVGQASTDRALGVSELCSDAGARSGANSGIGTPAYVDPVLAAGGPAGPSSDVFSLAAVALHCLSGAGPWQIDGRPDLQAMLDRAATGVIDDLPGRLAGCPADMAAVLRRALDPQPHRRGSAAEFALDLGASVPAAPVVLAAGRIPTRVGRHSAERQNPAVADAVPADLTHVARLQVRPEPVQPRRRARPGHRLMAAVVTGVLLAGLVATLGLVAVRRHGWPILAAGQHRGTVPGVQPLDGRPRTTAGPTPPATSTVPATSTPPATSNPPTTAPATSTVSGTPTSRGTPASPGGGGVEPPGRSSAASSSTADSIDPAAVLRQLADRRSAAFELNRPELLSGVYQSAALLAQDVGLLGSRVPAGCGLTGLRTEYRQVNVTSAGPRRLEVRATASQPPATLVCAGTVRGRTLAAAPARLALSLVRVGQGFRIASQRREAS